jgi:PAS domain S-box-containing protein
MQKSNNRSNLYKIALPLIIAYLIFFTACLNDSPRRIPPKAVKGVLDLSNWDFEKDGRVELRGECEFYWSQHLFPLNFFKAPFPEKTGFIPIPGYWKNKEVGGVKHPGDGFATYRLNIILKEKKQALALRILEISVAYNLYINGRHAISLGVPGQTRAMTVARQMYQVVDFEPETNRVEIILQVSNFHHRRGGGPWEVIELGTESEIREISQRRHSLELFLFGSILIIALYHLGLFLFRRQDRSPLYFSIFCFLLAVRVLTTGGRYLAHYFPQIGWELLIKIEFLTFFLATPVFALFIHSLFPKFSKRFLRLIEVIAIVFVGIVVFTPARFYTYTVNPYEVITIMAIFYILYVIIVSLIDRNIEALIFLVGFLILGMTTINDMLHIDEIIQTGYFAPFGFFFFILCQAFLLSYRFSRAMATVETQRRDLRDTLTTVETQRKELRNTLESYKKEIMERVQAENALRSAHERFLTVLDSIDANVYVSDMDTYEILFMNKHMRDTFGQDLIGQTCWQVFRNEAEPCQDCTNIKLLDDTGKPTGVYVWEGKNPVTEKWYINYDRAIKWVDDRLVRLKVATDVTELKKAEEALRENEEKYRTILQSIEEGYYEVDLAGNLTFFNDSLCRQLGYSRDELMGMNNRQFMSAETAQQVYETFSTVYETGEPAYAFDWEIFAKDGSKKFIELSVSLMRDSKGEPIGFRGVGRDISERKKAEEQAKIHQQQLMQASKMVALGTLVSGVAHEVNNPNNFIMLNSPILQEAWENAMPILEKYYEENGDFILGGMNYTEMRANIPILFSGIFDGSKRIKRIVDDLKNFGRPTTDDLTQSVDINKVLRSAVSLLANMIKKSTNQFSIQYGTQVPLLEGNFQRLEQVMINLINNACQALPDAQKGISITVRSDRKNAHLVIKIRDEGTGIPPETLGVITDPFFTTKLDSGGVGLGLSISSKIIKEHGGTIQFDSEIGAGTTATITLPVNRKNQTMKGKPE